MKKLALWLGIVVLWSPVLVELGALPFARPEALGDRRLALLGTTLAYGLAVGLAAALGGLLVALGARRWLAPTQALCLAACALPGVAACGAAMGFAERLSPSLTQGWGVAWVTHSALLAPLAALAIMAALRSLPVAAVESAAVLCSPGRSFAGVLWPLARRSVLTVAAMSALMAVSDYGVPSLYGADTYALEVFADVAAGKPAMATAWPMVGLALVFGYVAGGWLSRQARPSGMAPASRLWLPVPLSVGASAAIALLSLGVLGTVVSLVGQIPGWHEAWTAVARARADLGTTTLLALLTGLACAALGLLIGPGLAEGGRLAWTLALAPFSFPAALVGTTVARLDLSRSLPELFPAILAQSLRFGGLAAVAVAIGWARLDRSAVDAARVYLSPFIRAVRLYPLLLGPFVTYGFLIGAILSIGELGATLMTIAPGRSTATIRLYNALHYGASDDAAALGLFLCLAAGALYGAALVAVTGRKR